MAILKVIPYKEEHALNILDRNRVNANLWGPIQEIGKNAWTLFADKEIVFCGGIEISEWKRGTAWLLLSSLFYRYVKTCHKLTKEKLRETAKEKGLVRVELFADANNPVAVRYAERLGFKMEGLLHSYGPNREDMFILARIY